MWTDCNRENSKRVQEAFEKCYGESECEFGFSDGFFDESCMEDYKKENDFTAFYLNVFCEGSTIQVGESSFSKKTISLAYVLFDLCIALAFYLALINLQVCENRANDAFQAKNGLISGYSLVLKGLPVVESEDELKEDIWKHFDHYLQEANKLGRIKCDGKVVDIQFNINSLVYIEKRVYWNAKKRLQLEMDLEKFLRKELKKDYGEERKTQIIEALKEPRKRKEDEKKAKVFEDCKAELTKKGKKKLSKMLNRHEKMSAKLENLRKKAKNPKLQNKKMVFKHWMGKWDVPLVLS